MKRKEKTLDGRLLQRHLSNFIIHSKVKNKHTLSVSNDILIFFIIHKKKKKKTITFISQAKCYLIEG